VVGGGLSSLLSVNSIIFTYTILVHFFLVLWSRSQEVRNQGARLPECGRTGLPFITSFMTALMRWPYIPVRRAISILSVMVLSTCWASNSTPAPKGQKKNADSEGTSKMESTRTDFGQEGVVLGSAVGAFGEMSAHAGFIADVIADVLTAKQPPPLLLRQGPVESPGLLPPGASSRKGARCPSRLGVPCARLLGQATNAQRNQI
jgi:hypothetical protein